MKDIKKEIIDESYNNYLDNKNDNGNFGNEVLYSLCKNHRSPYF